MLWEPTHLRSRFLDTVRIHPIQGSSGTPPHSSVWSHGSDIIEKPYLYKIQASVGRAVKDRHDPIPVLHADVPCPDSEVENGVPPLRPRKAPAMTLKSTKPTKEARGIRNYQKAQRKHFDTLAKLIPSVRCEPRKLKEADILQAAVEYIRTLQTASDTLRPKETSSAKRNSHGRQYEHAPFPVVSELSTVIQGSETCSIHHFREHTTSPHSRYPLRNRTSNGPAEPHRSEKCVSSTLEVPQPCRSALQLADHYVTTSSCVPTRSLREHSTGLDIPTLRRSADNLAKDVGQVWTNSGQCIELRGAHTAPRYGSYCAALSTLMRRCWGNDWDETFVALQEARILMPSSVLTALLGAFIYEGLWISDDMGKRARQQGMQALENGRDLPHNKSKIIEAYVAH